MKLIVYFLRNKQLQHRTVSLQQHGFLVTVLSQLGCVLFFIIFFILIIYFYFLLCSYLCFSWVIFSVTV